VVFPPTTTTTTGPPRFFRCPVAPPPPPPRGLIEKVRSGWGGEKKRKEEKKGEEKPKKEKPVGMIPRCICAPGSAYGPDLLPARHPSPPPSPVQSSLPLFSPFPPRFVSRWPPLGLLKYVDTPAAAVPARPAPPEGGSTGAGTAGGGGETRAASRRPGNQGISGRARKGEGWRGGFTGLFTGPP